MAWIKIIYYLCCMNHRTGTRIFCFAGALLFSLGSLLAQSAEEETIRLKSEVNSQWSALSGDEDLAGEEEMAGEETPGRMVTGYKATPGYLDFSVGTSFSYMPGYGSGMLFYAAPGYTLPLNDRWSLHGGLVASRYQGINSLWPGEDPWPSSFSSLALFVAGSYRMNDRLILHGTGFKQLLSAPVTPFTPYPMDSYSLGATYRIGDNISIGASVRIRNGQGYYAAPFGNPMNPSPFGW